MTHFIKMRGRPVTDARIYTHMYIMRLCVWSNYRRTMYRLNNLFSKVLRYYVGLFFFASDTRQRIFAYSAKGIIIVVYDDSPYLHIKL